MTVHDCDAPRQLALLRRRMDEEDLLGRKLIQTFAPDTLAEARNRGFRPARV